MSRTASSKASRSDSNQVQDVNDAEERLLIQYWVPDVRSQAFLEEAERQSLAVAQSPHDAEDQAFINAISTWTNE